MVSPQQGQQQWGHSGQWPGSPQPPPQHTGQPQSNHQQNQQYGTQGPNSYNAQAPPMERAPIAPMAGHVQAPGGGYPYSQQQGSYPPSQIANPQQQYQGQQFAPQNNQDLQSQQHQAVPFNGPQYQQPSWNQQQGQPNTTQFLQSQLPGPQHSQIQFQGQHGQGPPQLAQNPPQGHHGPLQQHPGKSGTKRSRSARSEVEGHGQRTKSPDFSLSQQQIQYIDITQATQNQQRNYQAPSSEQNQYHQAYLGQQHGGPSFHQPNQNVSSIQQQTQHPGNFENYGAGPQFNTYPHNPTSQTVVPLIISPTVSTFSDQGNSLPLNLPYPNYSDYQSRAVSGGSTFSQGSPQGLYVSALPISHVQQQPYLVPQPPGYQNQQITSGIPGPAHMYPNPGVPPLQTPYQQHYTIDPQLLSLNTGYPSSTYAHGSQQLSSGRGTSPGSSFQDPRAHHQRGTSGSVIGTAPYQFPSHQSGPMQNPNLGNESQSFHQSPSGGLRSWNSPAIKLEKEIPSTKRPPRRISPRVQNTRKESFKSHQGIRRKSPKKPSKEPPKNYKTVTVIDLCSSSEGSQSQPPRKKPASSLPIKKNAPVEVPSTEALKVTKPRGASNRDKRQSTPNVAVPPTLPDPYAHLTYIPPTVLRERSLKGADAAPFKLSTDLLSQPSLKLGKTTKEAGAAVGMTVINKGVESNDFSSDECQEELSVPIHANQEDIHKKSGRKPVISGPENLQQSKEKTKKTSIMKDQALKDIPASHQADIEFQRDSLQQFLDISDSDEKHHDSKEVPSPKNSNYEQSIMSINSTPVKASPYVFSEPTIDSRSIQLPETTEKLDDQSAVDDMMALLDEAMPEFDEVIIDTESQILDSNPHSGSVLLPETAEQLEEQPAIDLTDLLEGVGSEFNEMDEFMPMPEFDEATLDTEAPKLGSNPNSVSFLLPETIQQSQDEPFLDTSMALMHNGTTRFGEARLDTEPEKSNSKQLLLEQPVSSSIHSCDEIIDGLTPDQHANNHHEKQILAQASDTFQETDIELQNSSLVDLDILNSTNPETYKTDKNDDYDFNPDGKNMDERCMDDESDHKLEGAQSAVLKLEDGNIVDKEEDRLQPDVTLVRNSKGYENENTLPVSDELASPGAIPLIKAEEIASPKDPVSSNAVVNHEEIVEQQLDGVDPQEYSEPQLFNSVEEDQKIDLTSDTFLEQGQSLHPDLAASPSIKKEIPSPDVNLHTESPNKDVQTTAIPREPTASPQISHPIMEMLSNLSTEGTPEMSALDELVGIEFNKPRMKNGNRKPRPQSITIPSSNSPDPLPLSPLQGIPDSETQQVYIKPEPLSDDDIFETSIEIPESSNSPDIITVSESKRILDSENKKDDIKTETLLDDDVIEKPIEIPSSSNSPDLLPISAEQRIPQSETKKDCIKIEPLSDDDIIEIPNMKAEASSPTLALSPDVLRYPEWNTLEKSDYRNIDAISVEQENDVSQNYEIEMEIKKEKFDEIVEFQENEIKKEQLDDQQIKAERLSPPQQRHFHTYKETQVKVEVQYFDELDGEDDARGLPQQRPLSIEKSPTSNIQVKLEGQAGHGQFERSYFAETSPTSAQPQYQWIGQQHQQSTYTNPQTLQQWHPPAGYPQMTPQSQSFAINNMGPFNQPMYNPQQWSSQQQQPYAFPPQPVQWNQPGTPQISVQWNQSGIQQHPQISTELQNQQQNMFAGPMTQQQQAYNIPQPPSQTQAPEHPEHLPTHIDVDGPSSEAGVSSPESKGSLESPRQSPAPGLQQTPKSPQLYVQINPKRFKCLLCNVTYPVETLAKAHIKAKHSVIEHCPVCPQSPIEFRCGLWLRQHITKSHPEAERGSAAILGALQRLGDDESEVGAWVHGWDGKPSKETEEEKKAAEVQKSKKDALKAAQLKKAKLKRRRMKYQVDSKAKMEKFEESLRKAEER
ncbi:hypothetical protein EDC01DRAFT_746902 [Geopyxis carbonaria]|nr:hypothetical protein EDC01DRAFT_746902 [Geopyxis carbonaria]